MSNKNSNINEIKSRPLTTEDGHELTDLELITAALESIDSYEAENQQATSLSPTFVQWMREAKEACDSDPNMNMVKYKNLHVASILGGRDHDYTSIINKTNQVNAKLEKQNKFKPQVVQEISGNL